MTCMHHDQVNNITGWNLLHDILNTYKCTKHINSHYSPILHICMNIQKGKVRYKNFRILFDSGCSYMTVMGELIEKLNPKEDDVMQCHMQAGSITTNLKVKMYLPYLNLEQRRL